MPLPVLTAVAQTIQTAIAPVFLLAGIGAILNVMVGRLARVIDRVRALEELQTVAPADPAAPRRRWELRLLDRRMRVINLAIYLIVGAAVMTCLVVATMFVAEIIHWQIGRWVALFFILAMLLLISGLVSFLVEVHISLRSNRVRREFLD